MEKKFDSVQIVREIRDKMYEKTKDKTDEELIEYYKKRQKLHGRYMDNG